MLVSLFVIVRYFVTGQWVGPLLFVAITGFFTGFNLVILSLAIEILYRAMLAQSGQDLFILDE